jgi:hypothetical protein
VTELPSFKGTAILVMGALAFAAGTSVTWLFIGRALVEFDPNLNSARASSVNTIASASALAAAPIVGGALVQYALFPLHLSFWQLFVLASVVLVRLVFVPRHPD